MALLTPGGRWSGRLSVWEAARLLEWLPLDGALGLEQNDGWGPSEYLLATVVDVLKAANWQRENEGKKEHQQTAFPDPTYRPGQTTEKPKVTLAQLRAAHRREEQRRREQT